jgi:hypothetical protein
MKTLSFFLLWSLPVLAGAQVGLGPVADSAGTSTGSTSRSMSLGPEMPRVTGWVGVGSTASMTAAEMLWRGSLAGSLAGQVSSGFLMQGDSRGDRVSAQTTPAAPRTNGAASYARLESGSKRSIWRRTVIASAALAAGGAAIAHWSSGRGDDAYDRYLSSAGERRREDAFDEAERYDRIAGAAFLVMEAGLVLTAYFVFF